MRISNLSGIIFLIVPIAGNGTLGAQPKHLNSYFKKLNIESLSGEAPHFELITLSGDTISLERYKGELLILHVWATWCQPCRQELPALEGLQSQIKNLPVSVLGISIDQQRDSLKISLAVREMKLTFPNAAAFSGTISTDYWAWGIPVTCLIDENSRFIGRVRGAGKWGDSKMIEFLQSLCKPPAAKSQ